MIKYFEKDSKDGAFELIISKQGHSYRGCHTPKDLACLQICLAQYTNNASEGIFTKHPRRQIDFHELLVPSASFLSF